VKTQLKRCQWAATQPDYFDYHDYEWGVPVYDDKKHFEHLLLDAFQAGLSWLTILRKRENFRSAFDGKNPHTIINSKPLVGEYKMGLAVRFNNVTAETGARFVTPKFYGADSHKWAYFKFGILF
jgi:hypothetical protein